MNGKGLAVILVLMFVVAIVAGGVSGGILVARWQKPPQPQQPVVRRGTLAEELQLNDVQKKQMEAIWQPISSKSNEWVADSKKVQDEEDNALRDRILTNEQKVEFAKLRTESNAKLERLEADRKAALQKAIDQTDAILNNDQQVIYKQIIKDKIGPLPKLTGSRASEKLDFDNSSRLLAVE